MIIMISLEIIFRLTEGDSLFILKGLFDDPFPEISNG
jgi:hypothetical protein